MNWQGPTPPGSLPVTAARYTMAGPGYSTAHFQGGLDPHQAIPNHILEMLIGQRGRPSDEHSCNHCQAIS